MKNRNTGQSNTEIFKITGTRLAALLPIAFLAAFLQAAHAGPFYWDPAQNPTGPSDGSGNWDDQTVSNWWTGSGLSIWSTNLPVNPNGGNSTNAIIGAGVPGTYYITNINPVEATTLTFSNAASYTISGNQLGVMTPASFNGPVLISLSNTTNTITAVGASALGLIMNQGNDISNAPNSMLTLATGVYEYGGNPRFEGISQSNSTVNLTGGTVSDSTSSSTFQITGITMNITNAIFNATARLDISRNAVQSSALAATTINVYNGGQLNANTKAGNNSGNHMQLTRTGGETILNVYPGGLVSTVGGGFSGNNVNTAGNLRILPDSSGQATLNVLGGAVLVGIGANVLGSAGTWNQYLTEITFFDSAPGLNANSRAILNMTGGSITAYEILFGSPGGTSSNPTNGMNITGGTLYLGTPNISYPGGLGANFLFNLSGGTIAAIQNWSPACSAPINLTNINGNINFQTADIGGNPFNMAFSGPLTGQGGFNLIGGGTLTLSGADNYSGATVISNGTLAVQTQNSPESGPVTLEGASLPTGYPTNSIQPQGGGKSWIVNGNLTYDTGVPTADFNFNTFAPSTTVPAIQVNGNLAFNVTPQVSVEGTAIPDGTYPLIQYSGTLSGTPPSTVILSGSASAGYIENNTSTKTIELVVTGSSGVIPLAWAVGSGAWNTTSLDWTANGASVAYSDPNPVEFNDSASGPFPITVSVASGLVVNPQSIMASGANSYAITGPGSIGGSGTTLTKSGAGTLTLAGTNTYGGGTTVDGGTLNINYGGNGINNSAIGSGLLTFNAAAQFGNSSGRSITMLTPITQDWNGDSLTFIGTNNLNLGTGPVTLSSALVQLNVVTNVLEVDGSIGDNGLGYGIEKLGGGSLTLSNANTFSGSMIVSGGTLNINNAGAVGQGSLTLENSAVIDNQSGTSLTLTGPTAINMSSFTFLGSANLDLGSAPISVISGTVNVSNNTLTVEGNINGANTTITKNGPGALTIAGSGTSGSVSYIINGGAVNADRGGVPSFGVQQVVTINTNGALVVLNPTGSQFNENTLTLDGGLVELNGDSGETLYAINFNSGVLSDSSPTAAQLNITPGEFVTLGGIANFDVTNAGSLTINGIVAGTATDTVLLKTGAGELILATNTIYAGDTTVSNGTLSLTYPTLSAGSTVTIASGAVLDLNFTNSATNVVAGLVVNGVSQPAGVYNSNNASYITSGGSLLVLPQVNPYPGPIQFSISGGELNLAWPTNGGWYLQVQTNSLQTGLSTNWVTVPGSASITSTNMTINPATGATFYRLMYP